MKDSAPTTVEWLDEPVPQWGTPRIKALFEDTAGSITPAEMEEMQVSHYSIPAFDDSSTPAVEQGSSISSGKKLLAGGELLFSKLNSHKPRVWLVPTDQNIKVASTEFLTLIPWPSAKVSKDFFAYLLRSHSFIDFITCYQTAVTNSHRRIRPRNLLQTHTILPPIPEQKRIAAYLEQAGPAAHLLEVLEELRRPVVGTRARTARLWPCGQEM